MNSRKYFGCRLLQRESDKTVPFFVFQAKVKDIRQWTGIRRSEESPEGTQRVLRKSRIKGMIRFLESGDTNTIPNSILIAFEPGKTEFVSLEATFDKYEQREDFFNGCKKELDWGFLSFSFDSTQPDYLRPALIVDGQHRLYGMADFKQEDLPVVVVALLDANLQEQAFQFIVINNKAVRVPADNAKSIIADITRVEEEKLEERLLKAGIPYGDTTPMLRDVNDLASSPFYQLLKWDYNRNGQKLVELTTIEQAWRYLRSLFGFLDFEGDSDSLLEIFFEVWDAVKRTYPDIWGKEGVFMTKVNITALNEFLGESLKKAWQFGLVKDIFDPNTVQNQVMDILKRIPQRFWEEQWSIKVQDNANVRNQIKDDLERLIANYNLGRPWHEGLLLPVISE